MCHSQSDDEERYIPDVADYAKAEWMARGLPKPVETPWSHADQPIYDKMISRETDGSDPLVQEPKE